MRNLYAPNNFAASNQVTRTLTHTSDLAILPSRQRAAVPMPRKNVRATSTPLYCRGPEKRNVRKNLVPVHFSAKAVVRRSGAAFDWPPTTCLTLETRDTLRKHALGDLPKKTCFARLVSVSSANPGPKQFPRIPAASPAPPALVLQEILRLSQFGGENSDSPSTLAQAHDAVFARRMGGTTWTRSYGSSFQSRSA